MGPTNSSFRDQIRSDHDERDDLWVRYGASNATMLDEDCSDAIPHAAIVFINIAGICMPEWNLLFSSPEHPAPNFSNCITRALVDPRLLLICFVVILNLTERDVMPSQRIVALVDSQLLLIAGLTGLLSHLKYDGFAIRNFDRCLRGLSLGSKEGREGKGRERGRELGNGRAGVVGAVILFWLCKVQLKWGRFL